MHKITSLELLRTPILCLSATKQIKRMLRPQILKNLFPQSEKVANANFKSKAQIHEKCFFLMKMNSFFAMQKTAFHEFEPFCRKSHFRA